MRVLPYQPNPYHARMTLARGLGDDDAVAFNVDFSPSPITPLATPVSTPPETTDFDALTVAQDSTYLPAASPTALPAPAATPLTPASATTSSFDWSKLLSSVVTAGGAVTTGVIQGQTAKNAANAQAAQAAAGQNALAQQAALLKAKTAAFAAMPSWLPWALGGGTILVIGYVMVRKHRKS